MISLLLATNLTAIAAPDAPPLVQVPLDQLVAGFEPMLSSGGSVAVCTGPRSTLDDVIEATERAEGSLAYLEWDAAQGHLDAGRAALLCMGAPVAANVASRIPFLEGVIAHAQGNDADARIAFGQALILRPTLSWDEDFAPEAGLLFDAARDHASDAPPVALTVVPSPTAGLWVDGRDRSDQGATLSLEAGEHLVQLPSQGWLTLRIRLESGQPDTLLLPAAAPEAIGGWVEDPVLGDALSEMLGYRLGADTQPRVLVDDRSFEPAPSGGTWAEIVPPPPPQRSPVTRVLAWGGGVVAVGAGTVAGTAWLQHLSARSDAQEAKEWQSYQTQEARYQLAADTVRTSRWVAAGGAALSATGLIMLHFQPQGDEAVAP